MKVCFKCEIKKPLSDYYRHKQMRDGHLNKCKECTKSDSTVHRNKNIDKVRAYDRSRGNRQSPQYLKEYRGRHPNKAKAHRKVAYEVMMGNITSKPCEICGDIKSVAHHDDYSKPLDIRWLCQAHHKQWHSENGEGLNG